MHAQDLRKNTLLFKASFNELSIVRVANELSCIDPNSPGEVLKLYPLKLKLRQDLKLTLYFVDAAELEDVLASS